MLAQKLNAGSLVQARFDAEAAAPAKQPGLYLPYAPSRVVRIVDTFGKCRLEQAGRLKLWRMGAGQRNAA